MAFATVADPVEQGALSQVRRAITTHEKEGWFGAGILNCFVQIVAGHLWYDHIRDHEVDFTLVFLALREAFHAVCGRHHRVPLLAENATPGAAQGVLVFHEQDGFGTARQSLLLLDGLSRTVFRQALHSAFVSNCDLT